MTDVVEKLNMMARLVFRTFSPLKQYVVVNALLHSSEYVTTKQLSERLSLTQKAVNEQLRALKGRGLVHNISFEPAEEDRETKRAMWEYWAFDYHALVNTVRYKLHVLKKQERQRGAKKKCSEYVCSACNTEYDWAYFAQNPSGQCSKPNCPGSLVVPTVQAVGNTKSLDTLADILKQLHGKELPTFSTRSIGRVNRKNAASGRDEWVNTRESTVVVELSDGDPASKEHDGFLVPPELRHTMHRVDERQESHAEESLGVVQSAGQPPWMVPSEEELLQEEVQEAARALQMEQLAQQQQAFRLALSPPHMRESMLVYYDVLKHELKPKVRKLEHELKPEVKKLKLEPQ